MPFDWGGMSNLFRGDSGEGFDPADFNFGRGFIIGGLSDTFSEPQTKYAYAMGGNPTTSIFESTKLCIIPKSCVMKNFYVYVAGNTLNADATITIRKQGADTNLVITMAAGISGLTYSNVESEAHFEEGDSISMEITTTGAGEHVLNIGWGCETIDD